MNASSEPPGRNATTLSPPRYCANPPSDAAVSAAPQKIFSAYSNVAYADSPGVLDDMSSTSRWTAAMGSGTQRS